MRLIPYLPMKLSTCEIQSALFPVFKIRARLPPKLSTCNLRGIYLELKLPQFGMSKTKSSSNRCRILLLRIQ